MHFLSSSSRCMKGVSSYINWAEIHPDPHLAAPGSLMWPYWTFFPSNIVFFLQQLCFFDDLMPCLGWRLFCPSSDRTCFSPSEGSLAQVEFCYMSLNSITAPSPLLIVLYIIQLMLCLDLPGLVVLCHSPNPSQVTGGTNLCLSMWLS